MPNSVNTACICENGALVQVPNMPNTLSCEPFGILKCMHPAVINNDRTDCTCEGEWRLEHVAATIRIDVVPMAPAADQFWATDLVSSDVMTRDLEQFKLYSFINKIKINIYVYVLIFIKS